MNEELRLVRREEMNDVKKLLREFFGATYYGAHDSYFDWQYLNSPFVAEICGSENIPFMGLFVESELKAIDGFLPWFFLDHTGKKTAALWDIEWLNMSGKRGVGRRLVKEVLKLAGLYLGYGYNSLSEKAYQKMSMNLNGEIERGLAIIDSEGAKECLQISDKQMEGLLLEQADFGTSSSFHIANWSDLEEFNWLSFYSMFDLSSIRNPDTLKWRYRDHPFF